MDITFEKGTEEHILNAFGKTVDDEGYVVDEDTGKRVRTPTGKEIHVDEFAGVEDGENGEDIFLTDDFTELADHVDRQRN